MVTPPLSQRPPRRSNEIQPQPSGPSGNWRLLRTPSTGIMTSRSHPKYRGVIRRRLWCDRPLLVLTEQ